MTSGDRQKSLEDLIIGVAVDHLLTVPEGVLVVPVVIQARHQVRPLVVNRVASQHRLVELRDLRRRLEYGLEGRIGRRRDGRSGQGGGVLAVEQVLDRHLGDGRGPQTEPRFDGRPAKPGDGLAHQAQLLCRGIAALIPAAVSGFDLPRLRQPAQDAQRHQEAATAFGCDVWHVRPRCRAKTDTAPPFFPDRPKKARGQEVTTAIVSLFNRFTRGASCAPSAAAQS